MPGYFPTRLLRMLLGACAGWCFSWAAWAADQSQVMPAWPPPPAQPDIVYVRQIAIPKDIGAKAPFFTRLANAITGTPADAKQLVRPFGLSLDADGNLVITDTGANAVYLLDLTHKKWLRWNTVDGNPFVVPVAAVHHAQTCFVADSGLGKVIAFDEKGRKQFELTTGLARPVGLAIMGDRLLVVDSELHHVAVYDLAGKFISQFGQRGRGPGEFNFPTHISVDASNQIYVTDSLNYRIQVFTADGHFVRQLGSAGDGPGHFSRPKGVAVDTAGHVYVVDGVFGNVQIFNDQGRLLLDFGAIGAGPGQFSLPNGIVINSRNEIYVTDVYNHRVEEFRYTGRE